MCRGRRRRDFLRLALDRSRGPDSGPYTCPSPSVRRLCQTVITQLLFERWDPLDAGDRHEHREVEMELRNLRDERLEEIRDFFRVDSNREVVDHIVADVLLDLAQVIETCREHVVV